jgi:hypothetical protein
VHDDVVQFPGDPDSFLGAGAPGLLARVLRRTLGHTVRIGTACPDVLGGQPADGGKRWRGKHDSSVGTPGGHGLERGHGGADGGKGRPSGGRLASQPVPRLTVPGWR